MTSLPPDAAGLLAAIDAGDRSALGMLADLLLERMHPLAGGLCALRDGGKWPDKTKMIDGNFVWDFWAFTNKEENRLPQPWVFRMADCHLTQSAAILEAAAAWKPENSNG